MPPKTRRPRTCLADCVGMRRCALRDGDDADDHGNEQANEHHELLEADVAAAPPPSVNSDSLNWP